MSAQTIYINGATGFNATWEIQSALQKGHEVVVSVKSHSKGAFLASLFGPTYGDRFGYFVERREGVRARRSSSDSDDSMSSSSLSPSTSPISSSSSLPSTPFDLPLPIGAESTMPMPNSKHGRDAWVRPSLNLTPVSF